MNRLYIVAQTANAVPSNGILDPSILYRGFVALEDATEARPQTDWCHDFWPWGDVLDTYVEGSSMFDVIRTRDTEYGNMFAEMLRTTDPDTWGFSIAFISRGSTYEQIDGEWYEVTNPPAMRTYVSLAPQVMVAHKHTKILMLADEDGDFIKFSSSTTSKQNDRLKNFFTDFIKDNKQKETQTI